MADFIRNFSIADAQAIAVAVTATTQRLPLLRQDAEDIMIVNDTSSTVFVRTGDASVVADTSAMPVLSGEKGVYSKGLRLGTTTHIAFIVASGTADIVFIQGQGS